MKQIEINDTQGRVYLIREQTGADDDVLSQVSNDEATTINTHIANVIQKGPDGKRLTLQDVEALPLRDKYVILFKSRIFSLSEQLIFGYNWPDMEVPVEYQVNLLDYVADYSDKATVFGPDTIRPYPTIGTMEKTLTTDVKVSFDPMDGVGEIYLLKLKPSERTINKQLVARGFKVWDGAKWVTVKNFVTFSSKEMMEIRNWVDELDPPVEGNADLTHPETGEVIKMPVIGVKDFFYPEKI